MWAKWLVLGPWLRTVDNIVFMIWLIFFCHDFDCIILILFFENYIFSLLAIQRFEIVRNDLEIEYLFSYWALAHPIIISGRGVQCNFDDMQWVWTAILLLVSAYKLSFSLDYFLILYTVWTIFEFSIRKDGLEDLSMWCCDYDAFD